MMVVMWTRRSASKPDPPGLPGLAPGAEPDDLGSQLEDLRTHVLRCERWARFDDRLDLALGVEAARPARLRRGP
jgi:hypothetical protein